MEIDLHSKSSMEGAKAGHYPYNHIIYRSSSAFSDFFFSNSLTKAGPKLTISQPLCSREENICPYMHQPCSNPPVSTEDSQCHPKSHGKSIGISWNLTYAIVFVILYRGVLTGVPFTRLLLAKLFPSPSHRHQPGRFQTCSWHIG